MAEKKKIIRATTIPMSLDIFCRDMLREMSEEYDVVALSSPGEEMAVVAEREGVRTISVPMERHISLLKDIKSLFALIKVFRNEKPYAVHSMTPKAGLLCMIAAWMTKVPVRIHTFTGLVWPTSKGITRAILKTTDKITCACATHIIPEGQGVMNDLRNGGITKKPMKVLGYGNVRGIDMQHYDRTEEVMAEADKIRNDGVFTFVFVGRIVGDKGINELVSAFKRLHEKYEQTRLLLIGWFETQLDPVSGETRRIIEEMDSVEAVGQQSDVRAWYAASDCFVFPSYREGFPNTVIEAGALGLPSIVTDINGSREIIIEGENGVIVPVRDADALYDAMEMMLTDEQKRLTMAGNSRRLIETRFEKSYVRKCQLDFYREKLK
ncbi:MAG: glycosyltransferase family 4 protein [Bacteroidaceae bacterium]|nr:glycosyltransferase family 4 protein [Bacteroidaceae bacterium]